MPQQYSPRSYGGPRYAGASLGVPYVSAYDPSLVDRYSGLMQQEYMKATAANQAVAGRQSEIGDRISLDEEGKAEVLGKYKDRISKIKETYNNDLALAAPELARAVAEERSNPWYAKDTLYTKEYLRRQKLLDQYGTNIVFAPGKDLPQGNLNNIDMEDIGFQYYNRLHLQKSFNTMWGERANKITDLGLEGIQGYPAFVKQGSRKGLTGEEVDNLTTGEGQKFIIDSLEGMGIDVTPETIDMLTGELRSWGQNLIGGESYRVMQNPAYKADTGPSAYAGLFTEGNLTKVDEVGNKALSSSETLRSGRDIINRSGSGELTFAEKDILNSDPELKSLVENSLSYSAFNSTVPDVLENIPQETQASIISSLREEAKGLTPADKTIMKLLEDSGIINSTTMTTPQGIKEEFTWMGEDITVRKIKRKIKPILDEFKNLRNYNSSSEGKTLAKEVHAKINEPIEQGIYSMSNESQGAMQTYFNDVILATSAETLVSMGAYIEKRSGKDIGNRKTTNKIDDLQNINRDTKLGIITYIESGVNGKVPELVAKTSEGILHIPLADEQGAIHGLEASVRTLDPKIINDVFRANYDKQLSEAGGSITIGEVFGDKNFKIPGLSTVNRIKRDGQLLYVAPVVGSSKPLTARTPTELYQGIATYINSQFPNEYKVSISNPTLSFLIRRYSDLLTPSKKGEAIFGQISDQISNQIQ